MEAENSLLTLLLWLGGERKTELQKDDLFQLGENELLVGVFIPCNLQGMRNAGCAANGRDRCLACAGQPYALEILQTFLPS